MPRPGLVLAVAGPALAHSAPATNVALPAPHERPPPPASSSSAGPGPAPAADSGAPRGWHISAGHADRPAGYSVRRVPNPPPRRRGRPAPPGEPLALCRWLVAPAGRGDVMPAAPAPGA